MSEGPPRPRLRSGRECALLAAGLGGAPPSAKRLARPNCIWRSRCMRRSAFSSTSMLGSLSPKRRSMKPPALPFCVGREQPPPRCARLTQAHVPGGTPAAACACVCRWRRCGCAPGSWSGLSLWRRSVVSAARRAPAVPRTRHALAAKHIEVLPLAQALKSGALRRLPRMLAHCLLLQPPA